MSQKRFIGTLQTIEWAEEHFGSLITNRQCTRRDVMRCVKAGLVESAGKVLVCDADGAYLDPEREREGFKLTKKGFEYLRQYQ